jgi:hypothetical protein
MEQKKSAEEIFLELMREETGNLSLSLDLATKMPLAAKLLDRIKRISESERAASERRTSVASTVAASTAAVPKLAASKAMLQASIQHTFDLNEIEATETERTQLLAASDLLMINGKRRLRLRDARRAEILDDAIGTERYQRMLERAVADDQTKFDEIGLDPISLPTAWLRCFLSGEFSELDSAPPRELKAALEARERLRMLKSLPAKVPPVDDIARRVELAELLEPLRLLIGAEGGWDGSPRRDRFVGREDELKILRAFVDELSSKSIAETLQRSVSRVQTFFGGEKAGILLIQARGGLGKSTLLAKFVLDHAMGQKRSFPFAYLDFDRASLDPGRPPQLLIEIARQVGLQFPQVQPELNRLANSIRSEFLGSTPSTEPNYTIRDPFAEFVEIARRLTKFGERAFLLVFDTMEAVQWDSFAMSQLATLLYEFRAKGLDELKVVASGRADIPELRRARGAGTSKKNMELDPLKVKEAQQMAGALGTKAIGWDWNPSWSVAVAGKEKELARREPLAVRVVVDLIARAKSEERQKLMDEISADLDANEDFVARVYFKRIVGHVQNDLAKKLAWPGLVVRRVTVQIIREFLAPLCEIPPNRAQDAFNDLAQEVWMVTQEGDALKHRQDLRARTLPLMRNAAPSRFEEIVRKAIDYFGKYQSRSDEDYAEWIYQRLLSGEPPQEVSRDLPDKFLPLLARAAEDFRKGTPAASYLASRTATSRLSPSQIQTLQPNDALYHLSRTSASTFALDDVSLDKVAQDVSRRTRLNAKFPSSLDDWARALWIKTGAWQKVAGQETRASSLNNPLLRAHLFWAARIYSTFSDKDRDLFAQECIDSHGRNPESLGVRSGVQVLALARIAGAKAFVELDKEIAIMLTRTKPNPAPSTLAALRTAIVLGQESRRPALKLWLASRRRGTSDRVQTPSISMAEIRSLMRLNPEARSPFSRITREANELPARFTDADIVSMADGMLEEFEDGGESQGSRALSQLFACRDEDWIVPIGYAAERANGSRLSSTLSRQLTFYDRCNREKDGGQESANDMMANMRNADEAGELARFASLVLAECDPELRETKELRFLLECRDAYRMAIENAIGHDEAPILQTEITAMAEIQDLRTPMPPPAERPPEPEPILDFDDPQKGRWGRESARDGRQVRVVINSVERDLFFFSVIVESTDWTPLAAPVVFHLHDSFPRSVVTIRRIENQQAILREWSAYGVFAIGAQVKNASGQWISLEIDLADAPGLPTRFRDR